MLNKISLKKIAASLVAMGMAGAAALLPLSLALAQISDLSGTIMTSHTAPKNFIINGEFEINNRGVTQSASISTRTTNTPISGNYGLQINATASAQTVKIAATAFGGRHPAGGNCVAGFYYRGDATLYKAYVEQESTKLTQDVQLRNVSSGGPQEVLLNYPCGDGSAAQSIVIESTGDGAAIVVDKFILGAAFNIGTVAQAQVLVRARGVPTGPLDGSGATIWGTEDEDVYGAYNASTGQFTAPFEGRFCWNAGVKLTGTEASDNYITLTPYIDSSAQSAYNGLYRLEGTSLTDQQVQSNACLALTPGQVLTFRTETNIGSAAFGSASSNYLTITSYPSPSQVVATSPLPNTPTVTRLTSGSGTYTPPVGVKWLRVRMVGGGGGGGGSGTSPGTAAGAGGATTFGSSLLTANGGAAGSFGGSGGNGAGAVTINSPAINVASRAGSDGGGSFATAPGDLYLIGGQGGKGELGPAPFPSRGSAGESASANSGSGGSGSGLNNVANSSTGSGGQAGGYVEAIIPAGSVAASYSYAVGAGGTAGGAGTAGFAGGAGGSGAIIIEEHYNTDSVPLYVGSVKTNSSGVTTISANSVGGVLAFSDASTLTPVTGTTGRALVAGSPPTYFDAGAGRVLYGGASGILASSANFVFDSATSVLSVANGASTGKIHVDGSNVFSGSATAHQYSLITDNTARVNISSAGDVGINTSPASGRKLAVQNNPGGETVPVQVIDLGTNSTSNQYIMQFTVDNYATELGKIYRNGTSNAVLYGISSDERLKEDFKQFNGIDLINRTKVYDFKWKSSNQRNYGFKAQELKKAIPSVALEGGEDPRSNPWSVDLAGMVPILVKAVQELSEKVEELEKRLEKLEAKK